MLVETINELDVCGGTAPERRPGLRRAVEAIEAGEAGVIVAAYLDRLVRSLRVQDELISRVERAGGQVLAVDVGRVTNDSAGQWLSGTIIERDVWRRVQRRSSPRGRKAKSDRLLAVSALGVDTRPCSRPASAIRRVVWTVTSQRRGVPTGRRDEGGQRQPWPVAAAGPLFACQERSAPAPASALVLAQGSRRGTQVDVATGSTV